MQIIVITHPFFFDSEIDLINQLFESGLPCLHLRKPEAKSDELAMMLEKLDKKLYQKIVIHDHFELAKKFNLKGIHFTHRTKSRINEWKKETFTKSCGIHSFQELKAVEQKVNYAMLSPIFNSISKKGYKAAFDKHQIKKSLANKFQCNVVALGGINKERISTINNLGFDGAAFLGSIWESQSPIKAWKEIKQKAEQCDHLL